MTEHEICCDCIEVRIYELLFAGVHPREPIGPQNVIEIRLSSTVDEEHKHITAYSLFDHEEATRLCRALEGFIDLAHGLDAE